jgi:hypothetical protein
MTTEPVIEIPPGYQRAIRFGTNWTLITSPYLLPYSILLLAIGGLVCARAHFNARYSGNAVYSYS